MTMNGMKSNYWVDQKVHSGFFHTMLSVQFSHSVVSDSVTPWTAARQASLSITNSWNLLQLLSIESVMPSDHLILCCPLLLLPSILPSIRVFSNELVLCIRWPKYWSFSISPSNECSGLISFRIDQFDLLHMMLWGNPNELFGQASIKGPSIKARGLAFPVPTVGMGANTC